TEVLTYRGGWGGAVGFKDGRRAGRCCLHSFVVLVEDLAHQLLQQILERRNAECTPELVQQDGEVPPLSLHVEQQIAAASAGGRHRHGANGKRVAGLQLEQVERVQHADDFVEGTPVHRNPAVPALGEDLSDVLQGRVFGDRDDLGARRHDLSYGTLGKRHDAANQTEIAVRGETYRGAFTPDGTKVLRPVGASGRQGNPEHR